MERSVEYKEGSYIYMENSPSSECYIVLKGQVTLKNRQFGKMWLQEGAVFGLASLISGSKYRETAIAQTDCEILQMDSESIRRHIVENKELRESIFTHIVEFLKVLNRRIEAKSIHSDDNIAQKIYDGFIYYYADNQMDKADELFERLESKYKNTSYYRKALIYLNQSKVEENNDSWHENTMHLIEALLSST